jgi:hypothetical protein
MAQVSEAWDELGIIRGGVDEKRELPLIGSVQEFVPEIRHSTEEV